MNFKKLADVAKTQIDKRGGTDAAKADAKEVGDIFKGEGSLKEKAKRAAEALKEPGAKGPDAPEPTPTPAPVPPTSPPAADPSEPTSPPPSAA